MSERNVALVAGGLGMEHGTPLPLSTFMADKAPVWQRIVRKHGLAPYAFETIAAACSPSSGGAR